MDIINILLSGDPYPLTSLLLMYEIKAGGSIAKKFSAVLQTLSSPLQPRVPNHSNNRMKNLSYPFSREKMYLYNIQEKDTFFDNATRSRIVHEILKRTACSRANNTMGINSLIANNIYEAAYPLHDGEYDSPGDDMNDRKLLYQEWARYGVFYKFQPIDLIREAPRSRKAREKYGVPRDTHLHITDFPLAKADHVAKPDSQRS
ncbi:hypothetical protein ACRRTK_005988 [Alexandromys fortis]